MNIDDVLEGLDASVGPTCLVTGGAGYLGRHLVAALKQLGCAVHVLDRVAWTEPGARSFVGDIRDSTLVRAACDGVDTVFHTASVRTVLGTAPKRVREQVFGVNVGGTRAVLEAARAAGVRRFVHTSSANVVMDRELLEADESSSLATTWVDLYGESKAEAESEVLAADGEGGMRTCALRPGGIWGPAPGGFMVQTFLEQLARGRLVATIGDGDAVVDNTHVYNLVRAHLLAARALRARPQLVGGRPYFITDDERINGMEWFRPIVAGLGQPWPTRRLPGTLMYAIAWGLEVAHLLGAPEPPLTRIGVLRLIRASSFRIDRAGEDLGYEPLVKSAEGLAVHMPDYRQIYDSLKEG